MSLPKVKDAFEVWRNNQYPGSARMNGRLIEEFELDLKAAFLAGAEYGEATAGPWIMVPCPKCGAPLKPKGDDFEACGWCDFGRAPGEVHETVTSPEGDAKCGAGHKDGVTCRRPRGHEGDHVFPGDVLRGVCGALRGEPLRGCGYQYCHEGKHSWEPSVASVPKDTIWKLDTSKLKGEIWDNAPQSNPDMSHSTVSFTPLAPAPRDFWVTMRCRDLAQAIKEWLEYDSGKVKQRDANEPESPDLIGEWIDELKELWKTL